MMLIYVMMKVETKKPGLLIQTYSVRPQQW
jgi:hypothetical protein